ncbi:MAG: hypothetical protein AAF430_26040 [Myxococcota bacterium]
MAEPKPAEQTPQAPASTPETPATEAAPKLVAVPEDASSPDPAPSAAPEEPERQGVSWLAFGVVLLLLVGSLFGLYSQSQRASAQAEQIVALSSEVETLGAELAAANQQVQSYDMQLTLVRSAVAEVFQKMNSLQALVALAPAADTGSAPAATEDAATTVTDEATPLQ